MSWEKVAHGNLFDLYNGLERYDSSFPEGSRGLLQLNLRTSVTQSVANEIEGALKSQGIPDVQVTTGSPVLRIYWRKTFFWLPAIVAILLTITFLIISIIGWQLFKELVENIEKVVPLIFAFAGLGLVGIVGYKLLRKRHKLVKGE